MKDCCAVQAPLTSSGSSSVLRMYLVACRCSFRPANGGGTIYYLYVLYCTLFIHPVYTYCAVPDMNKPGGETNFNQLNHHYLHPPIHLLTSLLPLLPPPLSPPLSLSNSPSPTPTPPHPMDALFSSSARQLLKIFLDFDPMSLWKRCDWKNWTQNCSSCIWSGTNSACLARTEG